MRHHPRRAPLTLPHRYRNTGRDRGSISVFFAVCTVGLFMVLGLLVDGGMALNAANRASSLAQEAARTAGQQIDAAQAIEGTDITVDPDAAATAAQNYLADAEAQGSVAIADDGQTMTVTVTTTHTTLFGALIGKGTLTLTGTATAHLRTQAGG